MKIKFIEDPQVCSSDNPPITGLAWHARPRDSGGMPRYLVTEETKRTEEQVRLQRSWEAVLTETQSRAPGTSSW